jgi:ectoine hydroxylase-related dioxygenase (phytanoyl-CoA dioxygenase family)
MEPPRPGETDDDIQARTLCIHFPHKLSELMRRTLAHPKIVHHLTEIIGPNVKCMQSMLFVKAAGKPGQAWHQDEFYIPTRDRSLTAAWIALDRATVENGCLWVIPGSHARGILWPQRAQADPRFDCLDESYGYPYREEDAVPLEADAGTVVIFNGYLLHRSLNNRAASGFRRALVNHYMSAESLLPWHPPKKGEPMGWADCRDIVMVAGRDPYTYKGFEDIHGAHVRPIGEGGCGSPQHNLEKQKAGWA